MVLGPFGIQPSPCSAGCSGESQAMLAQEPVELSPAGCVVVCCVYCYRIRPPERALAWSVILEYIFHRNMSSAPITAGLY